MKKSFALCLVGSALAFVPVLRADTSVFVASWEDNSIVRYDSSGHGTLFAHSGISGPEGMAMDSSGNLYVSNWGDNSILKFDPAGNGTVFANMGLNQP